MEATFENLLSMQCTYVVASSFSGFAGSMNSWLYLCWADAKWLSWKQYLACNL